MIIGHQKQWEFLNRLAEAERIPHGFLFTGQEKLGKKTLAVKWLSLIFREDLQKNRHPDLIFVEPENKEIQISQIRDLIWKLSLKPYSAPLKAAIIDQAHSMNQEAQTSLLKTLEEPKGKAILILITEYPESLFPTVVSRVQTLKFFPVGKEEIIRYLEQEKIPRESIEEITKLSMGRPGLAREFVSGSKNTAIIGKKIKELAKISNSDLSFRFQYAKDLAQNPQDLKENLNIWLNYFRQVFLQKINGKDNLHKYSLSKLKNILRAIQSTNFLISTTNVNPRLALEVLMLEF